MNKNLRIRILTGVALFGALFFATACNDEWDDHYSDAGVNSKKSLLDIIKEDADLKDFYEIVEACGCADSLLNQSRVYTLWAPTDFNKDSLLREINENGNRDAVLVRFIEGHITNYLHPANEALSGDNNILLLNDKVAHFIGDGVSYTFNNIPLKAGNFNIRARNGLLHKLDGSVDYAVNIWEYLAQDSRISDVSEFLYSYNKREFNPYLSIIGPTVNGETTYLDSVFDNSNFWFQESDYGQKTTAGFGNLDSEDSLYTMFVPTNRVWQEMVAKTTGYYNYNRDALNDDEVRMYDSLQYFYARKMLCNYLVFNQKEQDANNPDSLLASFKYYGETNNNTVLHKFAKAQLMDGVIDSAILSNGKVYITDKFTYSPYDLWHDTIKVEAESNTGFKLLDGTSEYNYVNEAQQNDSVPGEISGSQYLSLTTTSSRTRPAASFTIPNTLSASYYIRVVLVPRHINNSMITKEELKPNHVKVRVYKKEADGVTETDLYLTHNREGLVNDPTRIDSVYLYELEADLENNHDVALRRPAKFKFDFCEYGKTIDETTIMIDLESDMRNTAEDNNTYERNFRVDCIILEPVPNDEE